MIYVLSVLVMIVGLLGYVSWAAICVIELLVWTSWAVYLTLYRYFTLERKMKHNPYYIEEQHKIRQREQKQIQKDNENKNKKIMMEQKAKNNCLNNLRCLYPNGDERLFQYIEDNFFEMDRDIMTSFERKLKETNDSGQYIRTNKLIIGNENENYDINIYRVDDEYKMVIKDHNKRQIRRLTYDNYSSLYKLYTAIEDNGIQFTYQYNDLYKFLKAVDHI